MNDLLTSIANMPDVCSKHKEKDKFCDQCYFAAQKKEFISKPEIQDEIYGNIKCSKHGYYYAKYNMSGCVQCINEKNNTNQSNFISRLPGGMCLIHNLQYAGFSCPQCPEISVGYPLPYQNVTVTDSTQYPGQMSYPYPTQPAYGGPSKFVPFVPKKTLKIVKFDPGAILPTKGYPEDGGYDLYANKDVSVKFDGGVTRIPTGIGIEIPKGKVGIIKDRSSMAFKGLTIHGGVIDSGFTGEIEVLMTADRLLSGTSFKKGDKIAQILILDVHNDYILEQVDNFIKTERGAKGFGSSDEVKKPNEQKTRTRRKTSRSSRRRKSRS